jgi:tetratricopeptide (TPR) repeat protein
MRLIPCLIVLAMVPAPSASAAPPDVCADRTATPAARIVACTEQIKAGATGREHRALALNRRGDAYFEANVFDRAIADYTHAIQTKANFADAYMGRAKAACQSRCPPSALADAERALALRPDAKALALRGWIFWLRGKPREATRDLNAAIARDPGSAIAYRSRAMIRDETGDSMRALEDYRRAIDIEPSFAGTRYNRAHLLARLGFEEEAIAEYGAVVGLEPKMFEAFNNRGILRTNRREYALALADFDSALRIAKFPAAYRNRGYVYGQLKRYAEALADYDAAIAMYPSAEYYRSRAKLRMKWGPAHLDRARLDVKHALVATPNDGWAHFTQALINYRSGKLDAALRALHVAKTSVPEPMIAYATGLILKALGHTAEGRKAIDSARRAAPTIDATMEEEGVAPDPSPITRNQNIAADAARPANERRCSDSNVSDFVDRIADCSAAIKVRRAPTALGAAYRMRAQAYLALDRRADAAPDLNAAIRLNPKDPLAFESRAELRIRRDRDFAGAAADYAHAVKLKPLEVRFWARYCWVQAMERRDLDEALRTCEHALKLDPGAPYLVAARAFVRMVRGELKEAIADYDDALYVAAPGMPADPYALYGRGLARAKSGDTAGARTDTAAALALHPTIGDEFKGWGFTLSVKAPELGSASTTRASLAASPPSASRRRGSSSPRS